MTAECRGPGLGAQISWGTANAQKHAGRLADHEHPGLMSSMSASPHLPTLSEDEGALARCRESDVCLGRETLVGGRADQADGWQRVVDSVLRRITSPVFAIIPDCWHQERKVGQTPYPRNCQWDRNLKLTELNIYRK